MKKLLIISGLIGIVIIAWVKFFSPKYLYELHILNPIPESVRNIRLNKIRGGMHPPMILSFISNKDISENLKNNLDMHPLKMGLLEIDQKYPGMQSIIDSLIKNNLCHMELDESAVFAKEVIYRSSIDSIIFLFMLDENYCYLKISM